MLGGLWANFGERNPGDDSESSNLQKKFRSRLHNNKYLFRLFGT